MEKTCNIGFSPPPEREQEKTSRDAADAYVETASLAPIHEGKGQGGCRKNLIVLFENWYYSPGAAHRSFL
jgi:hypothetical protein